MKTLFKCVLLFLILMSMDTLTVSADATLPCGQIIAPLDFDMYATPLQMVSTPIDDCADPWGVTIDPASPYTLSVAGTVVNDGGEVVTEDGQTNQVEIFGNTANTAYNALLFKHDGDDYRYVDLVVPDMTTDDYLAYIPEYFTDSSKQGFYQDVTMDYFDGNGGGDYFYDQDGNDILDDETGETIQDIFYRFTDAAEDAHYGNIPYIGEGTYTMVIRQFTLMLTQDSFWGKLRNWLIPTAYAQAVLIPDNIYTITFTLKKETPAPTGASSVMFLPGIMGSHLYEKGQQCHDFGEEQQRWFSTSDCEQLRLLTTFDGKSINDIYTKADDDAVIATAAVVNPLYQTFFDEMNKLEDEEVIADFTPVAYDWRLRLDDLLKTKEDPDTHEVRYDVTTQLTESHLYKTLQSMVDNSLDGKVTIVAHSNGGLLAKTFLGALQEAHDPLLDKIDNVVLVASPQVGTPDAVSSMLQGASIGPVGLIVAQEVSRELLNTAPFAHHLLPNKNFFAGDGVSVRTPVVAFNEGEVTDVWRDTFGPEITTVEKLHQFLSKDSGREKPATDDLLHPEVVDNFLLNYANIITDVTDTWVPSAGTKVYQIAGTGAETVSGITYFTDSECVKGGYLWFECSEYKPKLGYYLNHTFDGDETVVVPSALAMSEEGSVERWWLNLEKYNEVNKDVVHKDIFEVPDVIDFVAAVIASSSSQQYDYLSATAITPDIGNRLSFTLHSPLDMYLESDEGVVSSSTNNIVGANYYRYGEVQYISVPQDTPGLVLRLSGYEAGSFTLVVEKWEGADRVETVDYQAIPSGTSTDVHLDLSSFTNDTELKIDFDGDGIIDGVVSAITDKVSVLDVPVVVAPVTKTKSSSGTKVVRLPDGLVAGASTVDYEWYYTEISRLLQELSKLLLELQKQK